MPYTEDGVPFVAGSETSQQAAEQTDDAADEALVLRIITEAGALGITNDAIEIASIGRRFVPLCSATASARCRGLVLKGLVCKGSRREPTRRKRPATCWVLTEFKPAPKPPEPMRLVFRATKKQQAVFNAWSVEHKTTCPGPEQWAAGFVGPRTMVRCMTCNERKELTVPEPQKRKRKARSGTAGLPSDG